MHTSNFFCFERCSCEKDALLPTTHQGSQNGVPHKPLHTSPCTVFKLAVCIRSRSLLHSFTILSWHLSKPFHGRPGRPYLPRALATLPPPSLTLPHFPGSKEARNPRWPSALWRSSAPRTRWWNGGMVEWWNGDCGMLQLVRCQAWAQTELARVQQLDSCCDAGC